MAQELTDTELLDSHRNAHRVYRKRTGVDRFNPFKHIPWVSDAGLKNIERQPSSPRRGSTDTSKFFKLDHKIGPFTFERWPIPEEPFNKKNQFQRTVLTSWINVLLICVPAGLTLNYVTGSSPATFVVNYLAEIPLWFMCDYALEEMEKYLPRTASDLLDIFTNNTVQIISSILLLRAGEIQLLQTSLIGGILSNILVLLGLSLISGGMNNHTQRFNRTGAQGSSSLLSIAATSMLIPTAEQQLGQITGDNLILQSRGIAIVLLFTYFTYTFCQMVTHRDEYKDWGQSHHHTVAGHHLEGGGIGGGGGGGQAWGTHSSNGHLMHDCRAIDRYLAQMSTCAAVPAVEPVLRQDAKSLPVLVEEARVPRAASLEDNYHQSGGENPGEPDNEIRGPQLHFAVATATFAITIVLLFLCIDATVASLSVLTEGAGLSATFVGLILLPVPNYDFAAVSLASDDYLGQAMKYTVGRSIQTSLLVVPLVVLIAWGMHIPGGVILALDGFEVVSLFTTILLLNFWVVDAKSHWVHGVLLLSDWILIAIAAYFVSPKQSQSQSQGV